MPSFSILRLSIYLFRQRLEELWVHYLIALWTQTRNTVVFTNQAPAQRRKEQSGSAGGVLSYSTLDANFQREEIIIAEQTPTR